MPRSRIFAVCFIISRSWVSSPASNSFCAAAQRDFQRPVKEEQALVRICLAYLEEYLDSSVATIESRNEVRPKRAAVPSSKAGLV